ncbi:ribosome silencing factor [Pseudoramibacter faecis]|uniref:ribosome silencing factor n=1 Tax=Pseudoramibacter faecis TaxID=3108534 RepID=UPI002E78C637|nr:ribosome silencing factor [Pseudoramibacter sp. HA2172]
MNQENNNQIFDISSEAFADLAQSWIEDRKGIRTKIIDVRDSASYADFFVITGGGSERQVHAIAENIQYEASKRGMMPKSVEGERTSRWILLDYYDVIIHVFHEQDREFYDLERLWQDNLRPTEEQ